MVNPTKTKNYDWQPFVKNLGRVFKEHRSAYEREAQGYAVMIWLGPGMIKTKLPVAVCRGVLDGGVRRGVLPKITA